MKKSLFLTLLLALFCTVTTWAQFAPEEGKMYALKETTTGLYLDIQTGVSDEHNYYDDCLSLSANPCVIYFAAGTDNTSKWTMKNVNGEYVMQGNGDGQSNLWIVRLGETAYEWTIAEPTAGNFTIARADGKFIGDNAAAGACLYCDKSTALQFNVMEVSYEQGDIKPSDDLMAVTTATEILIKNVSTLNNKYLAANENITDVSTAVLVWEPVTEGVAGTYYLKKLSEGDNGYIQNGTGAVTLGTKTNAQVFVTKVPATPNETFADGSDTDNLVRFVQNGANTWLNCTQNSTPILGNTGTGGYTVHNVYAVNKAVTEVEFEDTDPYVMFKTSSGTYMSLTSSVSDTDLSFQTEGTKFVLENSSDGTGYYIKQKDSDPAVYVSTSSSNSWGASTSTTAYTWIISEPDTDGYVTITRGDDTAQYLGSTLNTNSGTSIYSNAGSSCNKWIIEEYNAGAVEYTFAITNPSGAEVSATYNGNAITAGETIEIEGLVDTSLFDATDVDGYVWSVVVNSSAKTITIVYIEKYNGSYYLKTSGGTYLNLTPHATQSTAATFQATGSEFYIEPSGDNYYITQLNTTPVKYLTVSSSNAWDVTTSTSAFAWLISEPDANGYVTITKATNSSHRLGNDGNQNVGTGVFANVGSSCNTWLLEEVGPLTYTFAITNPSGEAVSATYNGNAITADETIEIDGRVDTSLFSANDIEGYAWSVELDPSTITLVYEKKYNWSIVNLPAGATITYNSNAVTDGGIIGIEFDSQYLAVTCPDGYTWSVTRDDENKVVTIEFTQLQAVENPAAVVALLNRIGGDGTADNFQIVLDPSLNYTAEQFSISGDGSQIIVKGTTLSAITAGIGWYLQNIAHINIAWNSLNEKTGSSDAYADLSSLPLTFAEEVHTSDAMYRYYLNYCTFGYSMTTWTWDRWQQEIDWMALHGINMPLQIVGLEAVWNKFLLKYGYTDAEAKAFVPGPAFTAWWGMNNLEGWGGTASDGWGGVQDDAWYKRQTTLAKDILARQRELGMQPVLPGWSAMVPTNFYSKSGYTTRANGGTWCGFTRPLLLSIENADYADIAAYYYECLEEVMGESQYYSMDPFHEYGGEGTTEDYKAIYDALEQAKPGAKWVIQQWEWRPSQQLCITAVPAGRLIVLDLFSDGKPAFDSYKGYDPQDAVFCAIPNYGGRSGLMGRLQNVTDNYFKYKDKYTTIKGIGAAPEAIEQTPVTYDLIFQLPWMGGKPDVAEWVNNYAIARYGQDNEEIKDAWSLLRQGPLNYGADAIQGPIEDVWAAVPNLTGNAASYWGKTLNDGTVSSTYNKARQQMLIEATYKLLGQKDALNLASGSVYESNYNYDLVEFGGGVLADYAYYLLLGINEAKTAATAAGNNFTTDATFVARKKAFLALIEDVDAFKGTNLNFRLGKWTQEARDAAGEIEGATDADADWYELNNARTLVTTWGDYTQSVGGGQATLRDYSYRSWQGLIKDVYLPRWEYYFNNGCAGPGSSYFYYNWNWAHRMAHDAGDTSKSSTALAEGDTGYSYTREPEGSTVEKATELLGKYILSVKTADGSTYYAYRSLTYNSDIVLNTTEGTTLNLGEYITFGNLDNVTMSITSSLIDGTATDLSAVTIKDDACGDADSVTDLVTVALSDGTSITLTVAVNTAAMQTAKENLAALIEEMEALAPQVATYNPVGNLTEVTLTTTSGSNGYIWTNAQSSAEGPIAQLIDGQTSTHFHTDYSGGNVTSGTHYIAVDLGADYKIGKFTIDYTTRNGGGADFPDGIVVYGSDTNGDDYVKIADITEPAFPQTTNTKWELGKNLYSENRYLRFNVLAERGYWHMSEFNIYQTTSTAEVVDKYSAVIENTFAATQYDVLIDAKNTYDYGDTEEEITNAATALQAAITALEEKMALVPEESPEHPELTALIANFEELMNTVADPTTKNVIEKITLQTETEGSKGYIWSNADHNDYNTTSDGGGIAHLVDGIKGDVNNYFHTAWENAPEADCHYIEVDLGESNTGTYYFVYTTRNANQDLANCPDAVTVMGSNEEDANFTQLYSISEDLPQSLNTSYTSDQFTATSAYRYLRFNITAEYTFWHMAEFELYEVTDETYPSVVAKADYKNLRNITDDELAAAYTALQAAIATNTTGTADEKQSTFESLTDVYDALVAKLQYMDEGVYTINFGGNPVFIAYSDPLGSNKTGDATDYKLFDPDNNAGTDGADIAAEGADALFTITHSGAGYQLQAQGKYLESTKDNNWSVVFFSGDEAEAGVYMFEETSTTGVYKLKSNKTDIQYINDWGEYFGSDKSNKENLSTFTLSKVTEYTVTIPASGSLAVCLPFNVVLPAGVTANDVVAVGDNANDAKVYETTLLASEGGKIAAGTPVILKGTADTSYNLTITMDATDAVGAADGSLLRGNYVKQSLEVSDDVNRYTFADATFTRITATTEVAANSVWMELADAIDAIPEGTIEPFKSVELQDGAVYRIYGRLSNGTLRTLYANGVNNRIKWTTESKDDATTLFIVQKDEEAGSFKLVSAVGNGYWSQEAKVEETAAELFIADGSVSETAMIYCLIDEKQRRFCVDAEDLDYYSNSGDAAVNAYVNEIVTTDFVFELVEDVTVSYSLTMGKGFAYATLYLPYAVTVPEGITAYIAHTPAGGYIQLKDAGNVIPASTPVVLKRETTTSTTSYEFDYTAETVDAPEVNNILTGSLVNKLVEGVSGYRYYMLMKYNTKEKFYWILKEYDETGKQYTGLTQDTEKTHIKCLGNKAYLAVDASTLTASASYNFTIEGTTGIEDVETEEGGATESIFDLQGRKLGEITEPGIYIVNGKKVIVK
ncbi:MAG: alpha-N-acetylglucosaminidase C-terminal domain-containing protein [Bacteroidaceae bacterium]|nr:alpha-N-acetylglucosaminidase C-terminal domain-containing protein [Bacteroidaceae bacterium]